MITAIIARGGKALLRPQERHFEAEPEPCGEQQQNPGIQGQPEYLHGVSRDCVAGPPKLRQTLAYVLFTDQK